MSTNYLGAVADLFSGGGGMSYGFAAHPAFAMVAAADAEIGKPSTGAGAIGCNATYEANMKVTPQAVDLGLTSPTDVVEAWKLDATDPLSVLLACPPCTGFSRAIAKNSTEDDPRNSLIAHAADYADLLSPSVMLMENVPQLLNGRFNSHFLALRKNLTGLGYQVHASVHRLREFGLAQQRERAVVIAVKKDLQMRTLEDLWEGFGVSPAATTVRRAISDLPAILSGETHPSDPSHTSTHLEGASLERIQAIPHNGGSWPDLLADEGKHRHLIPSMWRAVEKGRLNSYCDIYGRLSWDKPAPTIKRECSHVGNGRYAHPEQDRQCSVRELGLLQGFPIDYKFVGTSRKNLYRQIGDAVPPLISHQLAWVASWILTGEKPDLASTILAGTNLTSADIVRKPHQASIAFC
ncbi:DNA (cytosine-5)-methyltransferase 1 [Blastococcus sp. DSM 46786]|uniref:DNA cytosine methyltransferase n=1 Tax=Blastococcus sp. DSM 46786 TaxID=1798227 RepID=UPI0008CC8966|nr:DNA cytosine methyltransferase [Blastococcus sp. DSM 46786]SEL98738.1 DNA (cytosine-5)-methyltransferase 1 [Blastococcus sp. DSM 46786]